MTVQIKKSHIELDGTVDAFVSRVEAFRLAKLAHLDTVDVPAPIEHHYVEASVRRVPGKDRDDYVADYQIIDDTPPQPVPLPPWMEKK